MNPTAIDTGSCAFIFDLTTFAQHNGKLVKLIKHISKKDRFLVSIVTEADKQLSVKCKNLKLLKTPKLSSGAVFSGYGPIRISSSCGRSKTMRHNPLRSAPKRCASAPITKKATGFSKKNTTPQLQGRLKAWTERRPLDGTCRMLKSFRVYLNREGSLSEAHCVLVNDRFKRFEEVSVWLRSTSDPMFSIFREKWIANVNLQPKWIDRIKQYYGKHPLMTEEEQYKFWTHEVVLKRSYTAKPQKRHPLPIQDHYQNQNPCDERYVNTEYQNM